MWIIYYCHLTEWVVGPRLTVKVGLTVRQIHLKNIIYLWVQNIHTCPLCKTMHHIITSTKHPKMAYLESAFIYNLGSTIFELTFSTFTYFCLPMYFLIQVIVIVARYELKPCDCGAHSVWLDKDKSCPNMISLEKWMILTPLQNFPNNARDLGKILLWMVAQSAKSAHSGHTGRILPLVRNESFRTKFSRSFDILIFSCVLSLAKNNSSHLTERDNVFSPLTIMSPSYLQHQRFALWYTN